MHSIRTKITLTTVCMIVVSMFIATALGVIAIKNIGRNSADQILLLLCETGQKNLNHYFESVEQSVEMVSAYVQSDLDGLDDAHLQAHLDRVCDIFQKLSYNTYGVTTYYYRIDPEISENVKGFWYVNLDGEGFTEHEPTDISLYDTEDTSRLVWFTVPKATGEGVWLPPYITENLGVWVLSYNVPVYFREQFVGVIGIEIDYSTMASEVDNITLYENGYAFINDADGLLVYHPRMDMATMSAQPPTPTEAFSQNTFVRYTFEGVERQAVWLPLSNGMRLNVTVPVDEIGADWENWNREVIATFAVLLVIFVIGCMKYTGKITEPLKKLTEAAEQIDAGNYDHKLDYNGNDEVGILTRTFNRLTANLKTTISDLNDLAYADALTSVRNKGAFDIFLSNLQTEAEISGQQPEYAVCIFDCNNLKRINDQNGHDKGDIYLKETAEAICEVFDHSPVFRIGGDEFAALLQDRDFRERDELMARFDEICAKSRAERANVWEQIFIARGMAVYDPAEDENVNDVVRRADKYMYEDKWLGKQRSAAAGI